LRSRGLAAGCAVLLAGCGGDVVATGAGGPAATPPAATEPAVAPTGPISYPAYQPAEVEKYPNAKRLAARVAQQVTTYARGSSALDVAAGIDDLEADPRTVARAIEPLVRQEMRSGGEVVYPQLSGVTPTTFGAMVVVRQTQEDATGKRRAVTRVLDVRLRREGGPWRLDSIVSVGGAERPRPAKLSDAAQRVLDHPGITLSDSARWDIHAGGVDDALLRVLADAADRRPFSIAVLSAGHPRNVWMTDRRSAHTSGFAADIYAVGGRLVVRQQEVGSPAHELARELAVGGARQLGSPWTFGAGSFTDDVHADHIHVQQSPVTSSDTS
jgi:hypothetical protein